MSPEMNSLSLLLIPWLLKYFQPYLSFNEKMSDGHLKGILYLRKKRVQYEGKHWQDRYEDVPFYNTVFLYSLLALYCRAD